MPLLLRMKWIAFLVLLPALVVSQPIVGSDQRLEQLLPGGPLPEKILNGRSVVLYTPVFKERDIDLIHAGLVKAGIDAIAYFETDRVLAGPDVEQAFVKYFTTREILNLVVVDKAGAQFRLSILPLVMRKDQLDLNQPSWQVQHADLSEVLRQLYSTALNTYTRQNMLINDVPETGLAITVIEGRRAEAFASDLKVDRLAVQKTGDELTDQELEEIMKQYPFKYALFDPSIPESDLRRQGYFYILRCINSRAPVGKQLLGYDLPKAVTAVASITYTDGVEKVKTISAETPVYKYYFRQIEFNNVFLGTKWDADTTWQDALVNFISGFRKELRVN
jgi:hypothetical protein